MAATGEVERVFVPSSRRLAAATVHANGAAPGASPVLRDPSDDNGGVPTARIAAADDAARPDAARVLEDAVRRFGAGALPAGSEALAPAAPDEPAEPVVSANADGIAATADPTPNAIANAPTRPTTTKPDINNSLKITTHPDHHDPWN
jgi:hypothetical protein